MRRWMGWIATAAVLLLATVAVVAAHGSPPHLAPVVDADSRYVSLSPGARAVRDAIAASVTANDYGGISWDHDNNLSVVYLKSTPAATRARMSAAQTAATKVSLRLGARSLARLQSLSEQVWTRLPKEIVRDVTGVSIDLGTNRVLIGFATVTTRERAAVWTALGDAGEVSQLPATTYAVTSGAATLEVR